MASAPQYGDDDVVISGIGGYFPRAGNVEELQELLFSQESLLSSARWKAGQMDVCDRTGNVDQISLFDASFFSIHRLQSLFMDPMVRMVLQNSFEALIDAGVNPMSVRGRRIAVCMGSTISENDSLMFENVENGFGVSGQARCMMANRVSYFLNLTGPSFSCDATWLNGLQVLQQGCQLVRSGECEAALVGTTSLVANVHPAYLYNQMEMTSADGCTRAFDENASGYGRSDSNCVLYLQRASAARRNYASIVNVELLFNGHRGGHFTDINVDSAAAFLTGFYQRTGVDPHDVRYVEAYGAAIKALDEKELAILDRVYNARLRPSSEPLLIGSVKSNLGHTEASSCLMAVIKLIIAMETGTIPPNIDCETPNTRCKALVEGRIRVVTAGSEAKGDGSRPGVPFQGPYGAVNGFGLASSYGHILLKANERCKGKASVRLVGEEAPESFDMPVLHMLSSRTQDGIRHVMDIVKSHKEIDMEYVNMINDTFSTSITGHLYRGYVLRTQTDTKDESAHYEIVKRPIWFVYSGMGSQWLSMGKDLMHLPVFAAAVEECHRVLEPFGIDLQWILTTDDPDVFNNILHSFVGIAAVQIGLTDLLRQLGIQPDMLLGHSVGELGCAYADGCLTAAQTILCAYYRGRASLDVTLVPGLMAAVGLGAAAMQARCPPAVDIACRNGPDSCTISGPRDDMEALVAALQADGVFARLVNVAGIAYHSRYIQPAAPLLLDYLKKVIPTGKPRSSKWLSSSVQEAAWTTPLALSASAEYFTNNLLSTVYFAEMLQRVPRNAVLVEVAPHGLLQAILTRSVDTKCVNVALTKRGEARGIDVLFSGIGKLYMAGVEMHMTRLYNTASPPPQVSRGTRSLAPLVRWVHADRWRTGFEDFTGYSTNEQNFQLAKHVEHFKELTGHRAAVHTHPQLLRGQPAAAVLPGDDGQDAGSGVIVVPVTSYLSLVRQIMQNTQRVECAVFEDVCVMRHRVIPDTGIVPPVRVMVQRGSGRFEVSDRYGVVVAGRITVPEQATITALASQHEEQLAHTVAGDTMDVGVSMEELYRELDGRGNHYSEVFKAVDAVKIGQRGMCAKVKWNSTWSTFMTGMIQLQMLHAGEATQNLLMPSFIRRIVINFEQIPEQGTDLDVFYNYESAILSSRIVQMNDVQFERFPLEYKQITVDKYQFIKYGFDDSISDMQAGIDISMQIVEQCLDVKNDEVQVIVLQSSSVQSLESYIQSYTTRFVTCKIRTTILPDTTDNIALRSDLLIIGAKYLPNVNIFLKELARYVLICLSENQQIHLADPVICVFSYSAGNSQYYLLKQACSEPMKIINIKGKPLHSSDLSDPTVPWVKQLRAPLTERDSGTRRIYLVAQEMPAPGIEAFVAELVKYGRHIRLIIVLDSTAPECRQNERFYRRVFQQDVPVSVYATGVWGGYFRTSNTVSDVREVGGHQDAIISEKSIRSLLPALNIHYVGLNPRDYTPSTSGAMHLGVLDYSGYDAAGNAVMGMMTPTAAANTSGGGGDHRLSPDPLLVWPVPSHWSLQNAATVPYSYTLAYYVLMEVGAVRGSEIVLVHNGATAFGQAAIKLAHSQGCVVYTTVASDRQRAVIKQHLIMMTDNRIFDYTSPHWETALLSTTCGEGVHFIINSLHGKRFAVGLRCLAPQGRVVHLVHVATAAEDGATNVEMVDLARHDSVGMSVFFRCTGMFGMCARMLCELPHDVRVRLREHVQRGIQDAFVTPVQRSTLRVPQTKDGMRSVQGIVRHLKSDKVTGAVVLHVGGAAEAPAAAINTRDVFNYRCDKDASYVIYGDNPDMLIKLCDWLASRDAHSLHVWTRAALTPGDRTYMSRRLGLVQRHHRNTHITHHNQHSDALAPSSSSSSSSAPHGRQPPAAVIVLPPAAASDLDGHGHQVRRVAARWPSPDTHLVCMWHSFDVAASYQARARVSNVRWDKRRSFDDVLHCLDEVLMRGRVTLDVCVRGEEKRRGEDAQAQGQLESRFSFDDLCSLLSTCTASLAAIAESMTSAGAVRLVRMLSMFPAARDMATPPLFIMPGLLGAHCHYLGVAVRRLLCPVYAVQVYDGGASAERAVAAAVVEQIRAIQPHGPYNVAGVSSGGPLALHVTALLEQQMAAAAVAAAGAQQQYQVLLYLVDAVPDTLQHVMQEAGETGGGGDDWHVSLLTHMLKIERPEMVQALRSERGGWEARLQLAIATRNYSRRDAERVSRVLRMLHNRLADLVQSHHQPQVPQVSHSLTRLLRPLDAGTDEHSSQLSKYCKQVKLELIKGNHFTMLQSEHLAEYINDTILMGALYT